MGAFSNLIGQPQSGYAFEASKVPRATLVILREPQQILIAGRCSACKKYTSVACTGVVQLHFAFFFLDIEPN